MSEDGSRPRQECRLKSPGAIQAGGIAESSLAQAVQLVEVIRSRLAQMHRIDDPRASALANECEIILADIVESVGGAANEARLKSDALP